MQCAFHEPCLRTLATMSLIATKCSFLEPYPCVCSKASNESLFRTESNVAPALSSISKILTWHG
ncbi:unnamed protein product [Pelagomonas calceolata]|uniref:Uncharacterized protein n=1 Tax=Pelagomonas calceolata TaxID=35677 RepID=A0A8J2S8I8_9STRA|nr:unnamed protein product [Pelagomonas calceolata]